MYALVSDVHLHNWSSFSTTNPDGVNSRLQIILNELKNVADTLVSEATGRKHLYVAGDLFHVRGKIAPSVLNPTLALFKAFIEKQGIVVRIIPGNHDLESKDAEQVSSAVQALAAIGCEVIHEPTFFADDQVVMLPWYDKLDTLREMMAVCRDQLFEEACDPAEYDLIIHAPLNGVIKGLPDLGLSPEELLDLGFKRVFCGHYHNHKVFEGEDNRQVVSIGAMTHQTWADVGTGFGGLIIESNEIKSIDNSAPKFVDFDLAWSDEEASYNVEGNYVRLKLEEVSEKEIKEFRAQLEDWGALGCIVDARPKAKTASRSSSVSSGASLSASVSEWIKENVSATVDAKVVEKECESVLASLEEVE